MSYYLTIVSTLVTITPYEENGGRSIYRDLAFITLLLAEIAIWFINLALIKKVRGLLKEREPINRS